MKKTFFFTIFAVIILLTLLSPPLLAGNFAKPPPRATTLTTSTPEIPHYPISTTVPVPPMVVQSIPYTLNVIVDFSELEQIQFIDTDAIAYQQWGNLYIHHLITQTNQLLLDGNDITSFDWSPTRQQFVVTKDGRLLLVDMEGNLVEDLSEVLTKPDSGFEVRSCYKYDEFIEADNDRIASGEWNFDEDSVRFVYTVIDNEGHYCLSHLWQLDVNTYKLTSVSMSNDPVWDWLDDQTLVSSVYIGGGGREFFIIDVPNDRTIFTVGAWGTYPTSSPDGSKLAIATHSLRKLLVFDTATGKQIFEQDFGNENPDEDAIISVMNWSKSGRYVVLYVTKGIRNNAGKTEEKLTMIVDIDTGVLWSLSTPSKNGPVSIIWLPDRDEALMFERQDNTTYMSRLLPEMQQVVPVGEVADSLGSPRVWPGDSRYLPLVDGISFNFAYPPPYNDTTAGIWFWDREKGGLPYPIYFIVPLVQDDDHYRGNATMSTPTLSSDQTWLIFGQQVGWTVLDNPHYADITLQAVHLPSGDYHQITKWRPPDNQ